MQTAKHNIFTHYFFQMVKSRKEGENENLKYETEQGNQDSAIEHFYYHSTQKHEEKKPKLSTLV